MSFFLFLEKLDPDPVNLRLDPKLWLHIVLIKAYRKIDDDRGKSYELGQSTVFCMRGILGR